MKAVVKTEPGYAKVALQEVPEPHAATGQVVIEVEACGICGTDIHHYDDEFPSKPLVVLGHEMSGHIVYRLPDNLDCDAGALCEPLACHITPWWSSPI
jgi:threonine dehydrogenase-like Zn-dependent dehydrogenase